AGDRRRAVRHPTDWRIHRRDGRAAPLARRADGRDGLAACARAARRADRIAAPGAADPRLRVDVAPARVLARRGADRGARVTAHARGGPGAQEAGPMMAIREAASPAAADPVDLSWAALRGAPLFRTAGDDVLAELAAARWVHRIELPRDTLLDI